MSDSLPTIPAAGPVVLPSGRVLAARALDEFASDHEPDHMPHDARLRRRVRVAARDGQILCVRPAIGEPARWAVSLDEALDVVFHDAPRVFAVDPYDADGEPIPCGTDRGTLVQYAAHSR